MNFFEQELRKLFNNATVMDDPKFIGRACIGNLGGDLRVKAEFVTCGIAEHYEALRITVFNRKDGMVDSVTLRFEDVLGKKRIDNPNFVRGVSPHIWACDSKYEWYAYQPTASDYATIRDTVRGYLSMFQEPSLQVCRTQPKRNTPKKSRDAR